MPILSDVFVAIQYFSIRTVTIVTVKVNKHFLDTLTEEWTWGRELRGSSGSLDYPNVR